MSFDYFFCFFCFKNVFVLLFLVGFYLFISSVSLPGDNLFFLLAIFFLSVSFCLLPLLFSPTTVLSVWLGFFILYVL